LTAQETDKVRNIKRPSLRQRVCRFMHHFHLWFALLISLTSVGAILAKVLGVESGLAEDLAMIALIWLIMVLIVGLPLSILSLTLCIRDVWLVVQSAELLVILIWLLLAVAYDGATGRLLVAAYVATVFVARGVRSRQPETKKQ
jgi:FtsH-binding integral membrane protein